MVSPRNSDIYQESDGTIETTAPLLVTPLNPVNLRLGAEYNVGHSLRLEISTEGSGLDGSEDNEHEYDSSIVEDIDEDRSVTESHVEAKQDSSSSGDNVETDLEDGILDRIQECIEYTRLCSAQSPRRGPTTLKNISTLAGRNPSTACRMLRKAAQAGIAQLAWSSDTEEVYTIGVPPAVKSTGWGEHWWVGLSPAQIRAGPGAGDNQSRKAERDLQEKAKRQQRARQNDMSRLNVQLRKTQEGVRRQEQGLQMHDSEDEA